MKGMRAEYTRNLIKTLFNKDSDISTTKAKVSLLCPAGKTRMRYPSRSNKCSPAHVQCFDADILMKLNKDKDKVCCPVCDIKLDYQDFLLDEYFCQIISCNLSENITEIGLNDDGTWYPLPHNNIIYNLDESQILNSLVIVKKERDGTQETPDINKRLLPDIIQSQEFESNNRLLPELLHHHPIKKSRSLSPTKEIFDDVITKMAIKENLEQRRGTRKEESKCDDENRRDRKRRYIRDQQREEERRKERKNREHEERERKKERRRERILEEEKRRKRIQDEEEEMAEILRQKEKAYAAKVKEKSCRSYKYADRNHSRSESR